MSHRVIYWPSACGGTYGARIFVDKKASANIHASLRELCKWGNYDKTIEEDSREYAGYEFGDKEFANAKVKIAWFKILGMVSEIKDYSKDSNA